MSYREVARERKQFLMTHLQIRAIKPLPVIRVCLRIQSGHSRGVRCCMPAAARVRAIRMRLRLSRAARCCLDSFARASAFRLRSTSRSKAPCWWDCLRVLLRSRFTSSLASLPSRDSLNRANIVLVWKVSLFFGGIVSYTKLKLPILNHLLSRILTLPCRVASNINLLWSQKASQ